MDAEWSWEGGDRWESDSLWKGDETRYRGINVGWKKIKHHIGHFLVLEECVSIALGHKRKKIYKPVF